MQHTDRQLLLAGLTGALEGLNGIAAPAQLEEAVRERIAAKLVDFLQASKTVVGTQATVLIADLRGFTAMMESLPTIQMVGLLNRFFTAMSQVVERNGGIVDKFMGDSVMALFGAPVRRSDDLLRALICAVEMQQAMADLNRQSEAQGEPRIYAGIAVSTGDVMAGSFGSDVYREYTVIGDPVNLAARIESYTLRGQILLSEAAYRGAVEQIKIGAVNEVMVKGKSNPVKLYELKAVTHPRTLAVPSIEVRKSPRILVDFPVVFRRIEDKRILSERFVGKVNDLGYFGMSADLPLILPTYSEVIMSLSPGFAGENPVEVYARVLRSRRDRGGYRTNLQFTTIDTPGHLKVKQYVDHMLWGK
ncbi:adenylate/guanylate cyclase [Thiorhodococcus drewsii AZ1]|uniref:Adenylate/guanylate cyclase n=1 Tax=Thiorhodococcus drewsii AZ1 TaxID=765913 RepID=G2E0K5_9GAMM|nr:adenylate/guanylate cyclase domain-containing protein [Thiorhodococcus drewsii]EGV31627.1 adenylate/guanylate cyclase [Thiorhodococcus drewsii AZ1]